MPSLKSRICNSFRSRRAGGECSETRAGWIKNTECEPQFTQFLAEFGEIAQRMKEG
jgi:hypothetical protein